MESALKWSPLARMNETTEASLDRDAELMLRFKAGDRGAFEALFDHHCASLVNFAYRFVRSREVAEELAQEVFLRVYDSAAGYRPKAKFTTWLYRIATNLCLNEVRRPRFRAAHESLDGPGPVDSDAGPIELADQSSVSADVVLQRQAISNALRRALDQLPERQRAAFILNKYEELSYAEVAEVMAVSEKAVKSLIHRAKEALAVSLQPLMTELL